LDLRVHDGSGVSLFSCAGVWFVPGGNDAIVDW
jgi:hypothetical protein